MTPEEMETLAELIFQKMIAKQDEWDKEIVEFVTSSIDRERITAEINRLNLDKQKYLAAEDYYMVVEIEKKIKKLGLELDNDN
jgi:uncharacterized protein YjbK